MTIAKEKERLKARVVKVLLIEDNEVDAKWVARSLESFKDSKFQLDWSSTVKGGLEKLGQETYDVIISDLKLPDGFGLEVFSTFYKAAAHIPIILLTGTLEEETLAIEAIQKGAQDYLFKGKISPEGLIRSLTHSLERHKLLAMRDRFVNTVSHELRSPLIVLRETVSQIHEGLLGTVNESQKEFLKMALSATDRLNRTTTELLDLARMEAGGSELEKESFDLITLVKEIVSEFNVAAVKKHLKLSCQVPKVSRLTLSADRAAIARVYINLLSNALKFTETGAIEVTVKDLGERVESSVRDTGMGITEEDLPKVFNKFEQFGKKNKASGSGSGLGLSICKEIITLHKGEISVESEPGKGTRFVFTLPKDQR